MARGNGEKGGRGGRSHGQGQSREVQISKALSLLLPARRGERGAQDECPGLRQRRRGAFVQQLQWRKLKSIKATFDEIRHAVDTSDKKRFALLYIPSSEVAGSEGSPMAAPNFDTGAVREPVSTEEQSSATAQALAVPDTDPSHFLIRATQGHSMKSVDASSFLEPLSLNDTQLPDTVVHGTFYGAWQAILQSGGATMYGTTPWPSVESVLASVEAQKGGAKESSEKTVISGMRWDAQVLIYIDLRKALQAGCPFWRSENGVILSEGLSLPQADDADGTPAKVVPVEFFDVVVERKAGLGKLWEKGKVLQELPTHLVNKGTPKQRK
ncbi:hypothetical protein N7468_005203 [Penicillium chermesinum]|uniref:Uncharacterized protein n=1 Tax=Penicillium chermesinum TaxID=63820 RepID=A0A9W9NYV1_9EURO|nr:uncharacterized protein N7468_005203 [Penicillium chermesinum]KAJ5232247.1 hypothetical protein N7468_005203 [Penicillium chermesinum]